VSLTTGPQSDEPHPNPGRVDEAAYAAAKQRRRMARIRLGSNPVDIDDMPPLDDDSTSGETP